MTVKFYSTFRGIVAGGQGGPWHQTFFENSGFSGISMFCWKIFQTFGVGKEMVLNFIRKLSDMPFLQVP